MKVSPRTLRNDSGEALTESPWLTPDREYVVLAIYVTMGSELYTRIVLITDEGGRSHGMFDLSDFEITDPRPSALWRIRSTEGNGLAVEPEPWAVPGFWGAFLGDLPSPVVAGQPGPVPDVTERFDKAVKYLTAEAELDWVGDPGQTPVRVEF